MKNLKLWKFLIGTTLLKGCLASLAVAQEIEVSKEVTLARPLATPASAVLGTPSLTMPVLIEQFQADLRTMDYRFRVSQDPAKRELSDRLLTEWLARLQQIDFQNLSREGQVDYLLLRNEIERRLSALSEANQRDDQAVELIPYWSTLANLCLAREDVQRIPADQLAEAYQDLAKEAKKATEGLRRNDPNGQEDSQASTSKAISALRANQILRQLQRSFAESHQFYAGYDPSYTWWTEKPYQEANEAIGKHAEAISRILAGIDESDKDKIVGLPIGDKALTEELKFAMIPYNAAELVEIAEREFAWCEAESKRAADDLGVDGDWKRALELVKNLHVDPGQQPELIRELAWEAIRFLEVHDLLTVPPLAANGWRMDMMSPDAQRVNPYFLGGEKIIVSFPTNTMTHAEKLMSLRSNNIHFCRATVHHELIPGHHMQHYMTARYRPYRQLFDTPFWVEGWALYWEMLLWDMEFPKSAEDRVGMLFWRKHRCARIVFSLNYHLGRWTPEQCVQYLIDRVGHEPSAAAAEVRRSVMGGYGPLYQAAYMLGGLQIRALRKELVDTGKMSNREFHDAVIQQNSIPIEMIRAALTDVPLHRNYRSQWRFGD